MGGRGTFGHMAPELFSENGEASKEADMYAFGMVVYEVITGALPFGHHKMMELPMLTIIGSRPPRPEDPAAIGFGQGTWEFMEQCWDENPKKRPTAREALVHFGRIARTSTIVDPGPTIPVDEPVLERNSRDLCRFRGPHSVSVLTTLQLNYFLYRRQIAQEGSDRHLTLRVYWLVIGPSPSRLSRWRRNLAC